MKNYINLAIHLPSISSPHHGKLCQYSRRRDHVVKWSTDFCIKLVNVQLLLANSYVLLYATLLCSARFGSGIRIYCDMQACETSYS